MKKSRLNILIACFVLFSLFAVAEAQTTSIGENQNANLSISASPANPAPGESVKLTLQSFSLDLNKSKIIWFVNDNEARSGVGLKDYTVQAGAAGRPMIITGRVESPTGAIASRNISIVPAGVDLIYEVVGYTPPFYKGRAMNVNQGTVVVVAFPEIFDDVGRKLNTSELIFNWKKDGVVAQEASGVGRNYFIYDGSIPPRDVVIDLTVSAQTQTITAEKSVNIPRGNPEIIFYEHSPIYGTLFNRAITNTVQMTSDEFSFIAIPYYFSVGYNSNPDLAYTWTLNGKTVPTQEIKNIFTVRQEKSGSGSARIGLDLKHSNRIFQFTNAGFQLNFQKQ